MVKKISVFVFLLLAISISACKEEVPPQPTIDPGQMETQVAEEVSVQLTQIAISQPTETMSATPADPTIEVPAPTDTPQLPSDATATLVPASSTPIPPLPTNTSPAPTNTLKPLPTATTPAYACQMTKQTPTNGKTFKPGDNFDAVWTVKNIGTHIWEASEIDYKYESGDIFHQNEIYDLPKSVKSGESVDLIVDMEAPEKEGEYKTVWILYQGKTFRCNLSLEINVEN